MATTLSALNIPAFPGFSAADDHDLLKFLCRQDVGAVVIPDFMSPDELRTIIDKIYTLKDEWQPGAGPGDYTIGNVWYAYIAFDRVDDYHASSALSRAYMEWHFPGLEQRILDFCKAMVKGEDVIVRPGWGGPAFVNFTFDSETAMENGQLHTDHDGLPDSFLMSPNADNQAFSFVLPIQMPDEGGNLNVWTDVFSPDEWEKYTCGSFEDLDAPEQEPTEVVYQAGKLVALKSLRVHQIKSFQGSTDRITLNFRLTRLNGIWNVWF